MDKLLIEARKIRRYLCTYSLYLDDDDKKWDRDIDKKQFEKDGLTRISNIISDILITIFKLELSDIVILTLRNRKEWSYDVYDLFNEFHLILSTIKYLSNFLDKRKYKITTFFEIKNNNNDIWEYLHEYVNIYMKQFLRVNRHAEIVLHRHNL
jgi:hypothetical protein